MKVVLTGGPHAGKSSLLAALADRGVRVVPEAAIEVIREIQAERGDEARAWRTANMSEFQLRVARRQAHDEARIRPEELAILDRAVLDGLAYCKHHSIAVPDELLELCAGSHYDLCIVCELVLPFRSRHESGRTSDEASARRVEALLESTYRAHGIPVVRLPMMPLARRVERVLQIVG